MANTITLALNIFCGALIIIGMFWGLVRGLNKTFSRLLFLMTLGIILLFVTIPLTNLLLQIPVNVELETFNGTITDTMPIIDVLSVLMQNVLGRTFIENNPEFSQVVISLPLTLVYVIIFEVLFWTLKLLLLPLNAILTKIFLRPRKHKK